jgi:HD-like signal output (HDOD) protein
MSLIREGIVDLKNLIDNAQKLPNIPKVVQELIESFGDESIKNDEIAKKISADQVLTAKVLRAANSAHYGGNRKVGSVSDAVFLLGFNAVRTLVLASGMTGAFKAPEGFDLPAFWHNSFAVASTCKWLAKFSKDDAETAFTCGMIHNIGELLIHIILPDECKEIQKIVDRGGRNSDIEKNVLGFNFPEAGAELAHRWKFPDVIVAGIRHQLNPLAAPEFSRFAALINIADYIVHENEKDGGATIVEKFPNDLATKLGINLVKLMERIDETNDLIGGFDELLH